MLNVSSSSQNIKPAVTLLRIDSRIYGVSRYERSRVRPKYVSIRSSYSSIRSSYAEVLRIFMCALKIRSTCVAGPIHRAYVTHTPYIRKQRGRYAVDT